jgi:hypothetical protein
MLNCFSCFGFQGNYNTLSGSIRTWNKTGNYPMNLDDDEYPKFKLPDTPGELSSRAQQAEMEEALFKKYERDKALFLAKKDGTPLHLSFYAMTVPVVSSKQSQYLFPSMRLGIPFNVITHCLVKHPNEAVGLGELSAELKAIGNPAFGLKNLRENLRNSLFGANKPLSIFVDASSNSIMVKPKVIATPQQLKEIIAASQKK